MVVGDRVGLSEGDAQHRGLVVPIAKLPMSALLRTKTVDEPRGVMKMLVDAGDDRILGFAIIGAEAGEVTAAVQTAMLAGLPYPGLRDAILAHPTMAKGPGSLFVNVPAHQGSSRNLGSFSEVKSHGYYQVSNCQCGRLQHLLP